MEGNVPGAELAGQWTDTIFQALTALWVKVAEFVPNLLGMILILIIGYIISRLLKSFVVALLERLKFETASEKIGLTETLTRVGIKQSASEIMGVLVFWLIMLTFLVSAAEILGLENVSQTIDSFVTYLPNVIAAALVAVVGLMIAHFVGALVETAAEGIGLEYARPISRLAYGILLIVVAVLAIDQLGIQTDLIDGVIQIVLLATGGALALALGLGSRNVADNVVSGVYLRDSFKPGTKIAFDDVDGKVDVVQAISTVIKLSDGDVIHVPNAALLKKQVRTQSA